MEEEYKKRFDLLYEIGKKVGSVSEVTKLLDEILRMTQRTLQVSASSMLLMDEAGKELYFYVAEGEVANSLGQRRLSIDSGIAGWVARNIKPLIINNVAKDRRFNREIDKVTGFITKSILAVPLVSGHEVIGVLEVVNKIDGNEFSQQDLEVLVALASTAAIAIKNARLHQIVLDGYKSTVRALVVTVDAKDPYTFGHSQRVMEYALLGAMSLSFPPEELQAIEYSGLLHDIGKIGVHDSILCKPSGLTQEEWSIMRQHPLTGARIVEEVPFLEMARGFILHHHERYDGTGYPGDLNGKDIPIGARLLAIADAFDTMTTDRSYRTAPGVDYALRELHRCASKQFCPEAVDAFIDGFNKHQKMLTQSQF